MAILATLKNYWANNSTLNNALAVTKLYLDFIPPQTSYPFARLTVISSIPTYTTGSGWIESFTFQISVFDTDFDNALSVSDTIDSQFNTVKVDSPCLRVFRNNRTETGEVLDGNYTYHVMQEYDWTYNTSGT